MPWSLRRRRDAPANSTPTHGILADRDRLARVIGYDDRLGSGPGLRALLAGERDDPENVEGPVYEVALWLEFLGEPDRAARCFLVAADLSLLSPKGRKELGLPLDSGITAPV